MLKKAEVIEVLKNGGHIGKDSIYRTAYVYDADGERVDSCRYDTAENIAKMDGFHSRSSDGWVHYQIIEAQQQPEKQPEKEEEKTMNKFRKSYINSRTSECTESAREAMIWHRNGDDVQVNTYWNMPGKTGLHNVVHVHGAHVAKIDENRERCRRIAENVEACASGNVYRCPDCGEIIELPDGVGDKYRCPDCETVHDVDDLEPLSLYDYFEDCLDIKYLIGSDRETVDAVKIMVTCGGPNIYIDTESHNVELYWWGDRASYPIDYDTCNEIDNWAQELFSL